MQKYYMCVDTEVFWSEDELRKAYRDADKNFNEELEAELVSGLMRKAPEIEWATACYTGGGIYILYGKTEEGYFLTSNDWESILLLDESPEDLDKSLYEDWQEDHLESEVFWNGFLEYAVAWIADNKPDGNYDIYDLL